VVQFLIKEALLRNIPVVGYNRFFYESGAALAMVFDYRELGGQTGRLVLRALRSNICQSEAPDFHAWLNRKVLDKLGMEAPEALPAPYEAGP
jgi:putative ABC transport system substrate-binding protein